MRSTKIPEHVAIIMDGNGRWAKKYRKPRSYGHLKGVSRVDEIVEAADKAGVKVLTLFAFSSENWKRPEKEVKMLLRALVINLRKKINKLNRNGIRFYIIGRRQGVPEEVLSELDKAQEKTKDNTNMTLNLAFNYGSRQEIVDAVKKISSDVKKGQIDSEAIDEETISLALYTKDFPDPDLLIRTSGEQRISNFLLWQLSYSELYFTSKHWPEFDKKEFFKALKEFEKRERRYGKVNKSEG
ncbi:MAG: isoprenyl transferase [Candidatus Aceula meridiana]|nr:isoprenyl transferase [Candidatus Aceula meridiana]